MALPMPRLAPVTNATGREPPAVLDMAAPQVRWTWWGGPGPRRSARPARPPPCDHPDRHSRPGTPRPARGGCCRPTGVLWDGVLAEVFGPSRGRAAPVHPAPTTCTNEGAPVPSRNLDFPVFDAD